LFKKTHETIKILKELNLLDLTKKVSWLLTKMYQHNATSSKNPLKMLKKHKMWLGNALNIKLSKKLVANYVQMITFPNMKIIHMTHLHYSENKEVMTKEKKQSIWTDQ
jgi:hypothetical protein